VTQPQPNAPGSNGPQPNPQQQPLPFSPEQMAMIQTLGGMLADIIGQRWKDTGLFKGLMQGIAKHVAQNPGAPAPDLMGLFQTPEKVIKVMRFDAETDEEYEEETTAIQLLAEIADNTDETADLIEELLRRGKKRTPRRRKRAPQGRR
jgi:hypothetical protein